jgi:hypothetical protein
MHNVIINLWEAMSVPKKIAEQEAKDYVAREVADDTPNVIKHTIENVYAWATAGKTKFQIAKYLNLSRKEFDELITKYPEVMGAFAKGKEFANTMLSMSMYELAMGKEFVERDVVTKDGIVRIKEQIPPNVRFNALKFLLENQVAEVYGKNVAKQTENDYKTLFAQMSDAEKKALMIIEKRETINTIEVRKREAPIVNEGQTIQVNNDD